MAEKIKLSEIRAQFPMYDDLSDDQLLIGLRKKYYPDIPMGQFVKRIEYDINQPDPTEGMSSFDKFVAGYGSAMPNIARGLGQMVGAVSREDVADARKRDEALMNTGWGKTGSITGSVAGFLPTAAIPGANTLSGAALIGAGTGLAAPSVSTEETLNNIKLGGIAGPASLLAGRAAVAGVKGVKGLVEPLTAKGQERVAAATLRQFASDPNKAAAALQNAEELVPGSLPTMAQAAGDPGLAQLERTLANNPETGREIMARYAQQRAARLGAIGNIAGDASKREAAVAARESATKDLYQQATNAVYQVDDKLADLMKRPVMQQAFQRAQRLAANQDRPAVRFATETNAPFAGVGGPKSQQLQQVTGRGLQDLKMALDDLLSDPMAGIGKNEANAVKSTRAQLIDWMEGANPAFKAARTTFAEKSTPINTMDVASELMKKLQPALARFGDTSGRETAQAYALALDAAKDSVKKQIGINRPMEEVIDAEAAKILENIARDMARKISAEEGKALGSNTAQNLASQNLLRRVLGPAGLPETWSESTMLQTMLAPVTGVYKLGGADRKITDLLAEVAMNPKRAAELIQKAPPSQRGLLMQEVEKLLPGQAAGLLSYRQ